MGSFLIENLTEPALAPDARPLEAVLQAVEPAAMLFPPWVLQNVIAMDRGRERSPFSVPHRSIHIISRDRLLTIIAAQGWATPPSLPATDTIILLARPEADWLAEHRGPEVLRRYWQMLFHARVDVELRRKLKIFAQSDDVANRKHSSNISFAPTLIAQGGSPGSSSPETVHRPLGAPNSPLSTDSTIQHRIDRIGRAVFEEACFVLHRDRYVPFKADEREVYAEFAAVYLELYSFRPDLLPIFFPSITDADRVLRVLREDVNAEELLQQTRLPGSADAVEAVSGEAAAPAAVSIRGASSPASRTKLDARAAHAATMGNHVRAAVLRRRIALAIGTSAEASDDSMHDLDALANRLIKALRLDEHAKNQWRASLGFLVDDAVDGWWKPSARLLYDLQKVCLHDEREIYSVGVVDWLLQFCRRPLRRPQPNQRIVLMCKALRTAQERLPKTRLSAARQATIAHLIHTALHGAESRLREAARPAVARSIAAGGLVPRNPPEKVASHKLVEELLDSLAHRGFLTLGSVRDAISSNQLKFDDIHGARDFFWSDPLFAVDRKLSDSLDGIYHRGEIYLRLFQKVSSWAFATRVGRFITRTVLIPLGGAFIILEAFDHTLFLLARKITGWHWLKLSRLEEFKHDTFREFVTENIPYFLLAFILLGAVNSRPFRSATFWTLRMLGRALKQIFIDTPRWIINQPAVRFMIASREAIFVFRFICRPLVSAAIVTLFLPRRMGHDRWIVFGGVFIAANFLINSRAGRAVEQTVLHWLRILAARVTSDILGSLFTGVTHFFARLLEDFDRMLYAVDEWLRFREGQPKSSLWMKATLGVFWFYIAYFARFAVNLLVEPQVNPIKHFPVVTVSHKIVLPTVGLFAGAIEQVGISVGRARTLAAAIVTTIPGIFGFLAWELRANWKLYRANRPQYLKPISIGSHGETMARLLRPGFHSGTVPKLFQKARRSHMHSDPGAPPNHHQIEAAEHVADAVVHFIEREFIYRLNQHPLWAQSPISLSHDEHLIHLSPTRITIPLFCPALDPSPANLFFQQSGGWIVAGIEQPGWISKISDAQRLLLSAALLGLYKIAGVDIVKEQVESLFVPRRVTFNLAADHITLWPDENYDVPIVRLMATESADGKATGEISASQLLLQHTMISWDAWVKIWDGEGASGPAGSLSQINVLPAKQF